LAEICQIRRTVSLFVKIKPNTPFVRHLAGGGWKFGAPHAKLLSNPAVLHPGFGRGERQRMEVLL
jgi:hypothetical protein